MLPNYYQPLCGAISEEKPCGASLEYDPAFILLLSKLQPKLSAEYGNFVEAAEPISWGDIERESLALLQKSKDIRLLITLMRCRLRQLGPKALAEGLTALHFLLTQFPDDLHPQLMDEGEFEPLMRANALSELEATDGLLADLRNQHLPAATGQHITVKEYEKAHAFPREESAIAQASLAALRHEWQENGDDTLASLHQASLLLEQIKSMLKSSLGQDVPEFTQLATLLSLFSSAGSQIHLPESEVAQPPESESPHVAESDEAPQTSNNIVINQAGQPASLPIVRQKTAAIESRADALSRLIEVRAWFEKTEPSSPASLLLSFAEKTIGLSFSALLKILPAEVIALISTDKE